MALMNRAKFAKCLEEGLNTVFGMSYREHPEEWKMCFDVDTSFKASEEDVLVTGLGAAQHKAEGGAVAYDEGIEGWSARYVHETIALAFAISEEQIEDNLYSQSGMKNAKALARSMKETKEIRGARVFNRAFSTLALGGDGKPLMATDHPLLSGGVASNTLQTPADLSETAIEDLLIQIRLAEDDRGLPISMNARNIIIPAQQEYVACRILKSALRSGTADNDVNAIYQKGIFGSDPVVMTRLTDPDVWFIKTDCPDGLRHFNRKSVKRWMEGDFETGNMRYKARERYSFGHTDWRGLYGSSGSA